VVNRTENKNKNALNISSILAVSRLKQKP
jgi:hypothetical protein